MTSLWPTLFAGLLSLAGVSGLGRLLIRPLGRLPQHWYAALAMLSGFALSSVSFQCLAMAGSGRTGFRLLGAGIVVAGIAGHWIGRGRYSPLLLPPAGPFRAFAPILVGLMLVPPALISLAPSTKIDELHYHMLTGRRILEDHGLRVYQLPAEQAIVPQMGYQIAETVFHATNTVDAGNILSLGFGMVLWILIYGVVAEETGRPEVGLFAAAACATGLYPAVWYLTAGPHALGDLATVTGVAALLFPGGLAKSTNDGDTTRSFACVLGAVCAASTKISLAPVAALMTAAVLLQPRGASRAPASRAQSVAVAVGLWLFMIGPLVTWTYVHTGSPFGAACAQLFGRTVYQPVVFQALTDSLSINQGGLGSALFNAVQTLNGGSLLLALAGVAASLRQWKRYAILLFLVTLQVLLIATLLPHDFRFLGGLQYGFLAIGAIGLTPLWQARGSVKRVAAAALLLLGPWFAAELYYTRPFIAVVLGATTREDFLKRYVAFTDDFQALDKILPQGSTLYAPTERLPALYAPRPVIFTVADWDRRTPLYRLFVQSSGEPAGPRPEAGLICSEEVYRNPNAVVAAFRTPNREPERDTVVVQRCTVEE